MDTEGLEGEMELLETEKGFQAESSSFAVRAGVAVVVDEEPETLELAKASFPLLAKVNHCSASSKALALVPIPFTPPFVSPSMKGFQSANALTGVEDDLTSEGVEVTEEEEEEVFWWSDMDVDVEKGSSSELWRV